MLWHHFGTALTQQQGWLLRKNSEQIVLSFDSDEAGLTAKVRALDILQNMGCDIRILQMEGAKDPDEYIIKYGNARFQSLIEKAISVIEFKVKILKRNLNLENTNDKIKFLNEIAKLISKIDNTIEREVYIENIAKEYQISKEAIYAEVNKLFYTENKKVASEKTLNRAKPINSHSQTERKEVSEAVKRRENTVLAILLLGDPNIYQTIKQNISIEDFKDELNKQIAKKMYEEYEKGNSNINGILDTLGEEEQNHITKIMADDYEIEDIEKAIDDVLQSYEKDKLNERKFEILELIETNLEDNQKKELEKELSEIIISLAKMK